MAGGHIGTKAAQNQTRGCKHINFLNHPVTENIIDMELQVVLAAAIIYKFCSSVRNEK